jgi:hypothetical protein
MRTTRMEAWDGARTDLHVPDDVPVIINDTGSGASKRSLRESDLARAAGIRKSIDKEAVSLGVWAAFRCYKTERIDSRGGIEDEGIAVKMQSGNVGAGGTQEADGEG